MSRILTQWSLFRGIALCGVVALLPTSGLSQASHATRSPGARKTSGTKVLPRSGSVKLPATGTAKTSGTVKELDRLEHQSLGKPGQTVSRKRSPAASAPKTSHSAHSAPPISFAYRGPKGSTNANKAPAPTKVR